MKYVFTALYLFITFLALDAHAKKQDTSLPNQLASSDSSDGRLKCILGGHEDDITDASWSPDSKYVVTSSRDQSAMVWEAATGKRLMTLYATEEINYVSWSKDGTKIETSSDFRIINLWDAKNGNNLLHLEGSSFEWSPDGSSFSYVALDSILLIKDAATFGTLHSLQLKNKLIYRAHWSTDSKNIAGLATDSNVVVWDVATEKLLSTYAAARRVKDIHWNSLNDYLMVVMDSVFMKLDVRNGIPISTNYISSSLPWGNVFWSNSGKQVAFLGFTKEVWSPETWTRKYSLEEHTDNVNFITWSPDEKYFATSSNDNSCIVWNAATGKQLFTLRGHRTHVGVLSWSPDGLYLLSGGMYVPPSFRSNSAGDFTAIIWDPMTGTLLHRMMPHNAPVMDYTWHPDGTKIASAGLDSTVIIWDIASNDTVRIFRGHKSSIYAVEWSPNGIMLCSASGDSTAIIWNPNTGTTISTIQPQSWNTKLGWNQSSDKVYTISSTNTSIWDVSTGNMLVYFPNFNRGASWSPDGSKFASLGKDTIIIWDATTWVEYLRIVIPSHTNTSVNWSPDGSHIVLLDKTTLKIWNLQSKAILFTIPNQSSSLPIIQWSSDGSEFSFLNFNSTTSINSMDFYNSQTGLKVRSFTESITTYLQNYLSPSASLLIGVKRNPSISMNYITIIDAKTGKEKLLFPFHTYDYPNDVTWSPNGKYIASSNRSTIKIWRVEDVNSVVESLPVLQPASTSFSLYPNPTDNNLHLHFTTTSALATTVRVVNLLGQEMLTTQVPAAVNEWTLPMGHLPSGVYLVEWNGAVQKVVVH
ncbi:MAG: T9SS type A sorting domain-containing protein [Ignavibacteria bacterium]|nr:T9SS type A sorting domain-containing protein [Ignavibacteria bacterium]